MTESVNGTMTAFVVVIDEDGAPSLHLDLPEKFLASEPRRQATLRDVRRALLDLSADIAAQASAQYVLLQNPVPETVGESVGRALSQRQVES